MTPNRALILGIVVLALGLIAFFGTFIVQQTEQAVVLRFGAINRTVDQPGLHFKIPLAEEVRTLEKRVLNLDPPAETVVLSDQRRLVVDAFVRYRIVDPTQFIRVAIDEVTLQNRLQPIVNNSLRSVLGKVLLGSILSEERDNLTQEITQQVASAVRSTASNFGIDVLDVRIVRADLHPDVSQAVYDRMRAERERDAAEFRAQGQEQFQAITAAADREATVIRAQAQRESEILRGNGDAERTGILAAAYGRDPSFFRFYRTMDAYRNSLRSDNTRFVLPPDGDFFRYFNEPTGVVPSGSE